MKTGLYPLLLALSLWLPFAAFSQEENTPWKNLSANSNQLRVKLTGKKYILTFPPKGTHFYHTDFLPAKITLENGEAIDSIMVRYNSYLDELICYNPNLSSLFVIDKFIVKEFEVAGPNSKRERFRKIIFEDEENDGHYLRVLYEGETDVFAFYKTDEIKSAVYKDSNGILQNTEYLQNETFYSKVAGGGLKKFTPGRESFYQLYGKNKKELKQVLRKFRLSRLSADELGEVFRRLEEAGPTK
jgi:hypothetical protein